MMKNKKILGTIMIVMIIMTCFPVSSVVKAADARIPYVHISVPNPSTVYAGGSVSFKITADRATSLNVKTTDIGIAGDGVTLTKSVSGSGAMITVTLSNIQGPVDKRVSIALKAGVAKNEYGDSLMTSKSAAFTIVAKPTPPPVVTPPVTPMPVTPTPVIPTPVTPTPVKPTPVKPVPVPNTNLNDKENSISNVTNNTIAPITEQETTNVSPLDIKDAIKPIITVEAPKPNTILVGESVDYTVNYADEKALGNITLSAENVKLYGFTAEVSIIATGNNKRIIHLANIKGSLGSQKYISIAPGTVSDAGGNKDLGIKKSEAFKIVDKDSKQDKPDDWVQNPNTGR